MNELPDHFAEVLDRAHEMAVLAAVEAGTPEDCADAALVVVLHHLRAEYAAAGAQASVEKIDPLLRKLGQ